MKHLLGEAEVAKALGLEVRTVQRWRSEGRGPAFCKLGGAVRYDPDDVDAFIIANRRTSTATGEAA